jgi:hypothetical protein
MKYLKIFSLADHPQEVSFLETSSVNKKVECDVYSFINDDEKDLGIIKIKAGGKTPLQKILKGKKTIEGYVSGVGSLTVNEEGGQKKVYKVNEDTKSFSVDLSIGDTMQWSASRDSELVAYEVCYPPYEDGRFEDL